MKKEEQDLVIRFSVSLQQNLLDELDNKIIKNGYSSRSELVRDMIREKITQDCWEEQTLEPQIAVLVLVYDHHQKDLNQKMIDTQHNNNAMILCTTHVHIDSYNCLETIILKGIPSDIQKLSLEIGGLKGVKFSKLTKTSSFDKSK